ncbi:hypothetical protein AP20H10_09420 [Apilactobacillus apinorum]|uniref:Uncharacterized protein n=1 Tax=Apilactobacillus apinorum TaxID=1218495 RepID=A0ABP9ZIE1_9LACO
MKEPTQAPKKEIINMKNTSTINTKEFGKTLTLFCQRDNIIKCLFIR